MSKYLTGFLNLLKIRGSATIKYNGDQGIFIPFKKNGAGVVLNGEGEKRRADFRVIIVPYKDKYDNDFMVVRCKTAWEFKHKKATEIIGNLRFSSDGFFELEPEEDYAPDIVNFISESNNTEEREVDL